jgi:hypothetical protein
MESLPISAFTRCPECGGDNSRQAAKCWLCGAAITGAAKSSDQVTATVVTEPANPYLAPRSNAAAAAPVQFQLSSLLLAVTVVCLCLGLLRMAPGLVVPLLVISVPALVRALAVSRRATTAGMPMAAGAKIGAFITSLCIVVLVLLAGCVAFCMACFAAFATTSGQNILIVLVTGALAGVALMAATFIATWPKAK